MRSIFGFVGAFALGLVLSVGCSEGGGEGGSGGTAGSGGMAGTGGTAGSDLCAGVICEDTECKTDGACSPSDGMCDYTLLADGTACFYPGSVPQVGECIDGVCAPMGAFPCTEQGIRDAIVEGGGPHFFACDGPQTVVIDAQIVVDNDVILDGEGNLTVDGNANVRAFHVLAGVTAELRGFTLTGAGSGVGISNIGTLTLTNSTMSGNGTGISNDGTTTLVQTTASDNGTGVSNKGTATLMNSNVLGNGRGISNQGTATLINSTVSGNDLGILNPESVTLKLTNSAVTGNTGLGIHNLGTAMLTQNTLSGNYTGIFNGGTATLIQSTVSGNSYAGIDNSGAGTLTLSNTLVDDNCLGAVVSNGYNIESPGDTCGFDQTGDQPGVTAEALALEPLADNGGPTMTHALLPGSVAIDQIPEADCVDADGQPLTTDQRGEPRPETGSTMCDVGALERQPSWGAAVRIETYVGDAYFPSVAVDPDGNATAVWEQSDGTRLDLWANHYTRAAGWGTPAPIEADDTGSVVSATTAVDHNGNAIVVWQQCESTLCNIWSDRHTPSGGWGAPVLVETDDTGDVRGGGGRGQVAVDPDGNAIVVWHQSDGTRYNVWSNRYTPSGGWGTPVPVETDDTGDAGGAQVAVDPNGNAIVVWLQFVPQPGGRIHSDLWSNRYTPSGGWGTAVLVGPLAQGDAAGPQVAMDPNGNATLVWVQTYVANVIWSRRYTPSGGWGPAVSIDSSTWPVYGLDVVVDRDGNATAIWEGTDGWDIWSSHYTNTPSGGWGQAVPVQTDDIGGSSPQLAVDSAGNVMAVWVESDGNSPWSVWSRRYTPKEGWGVPVLVETDDTGDAAYPVVAVDARGNATAVWHQSDGVRFNIWSNHFE